MTFIPIDTGNFQWGLTEDRLNEVIAWHNNEWIKDHPTMAPS
jgi:hypothetical protein